MLFLWLPGVKLSKKVICPQCKIEVPIENFLYNENDPFLHRKDGGCAKCSKKCEHCKRVISLDEVRLVHTKSGTVAVCVYCARQHYSMCEMCSIFLDKKDAILVEDKGENDEGYVKGEGFEVCKKCLNKYYKLCIQCKKPVSDELVVEFLGDFYHETCIPDEQPQLVDFSSIDPSKFKNFSWSEQEYILDFIEKIAPISVQQIKKNYHNLYVQIQDLIKENNGKDFTADYVKLKKKELKPQTFEIDYSAWFATQRSYLQSEPQIVLKIKANNEFLSIIESNSYYKILFKFSQLLNNTRGHPWSNDSLGWVRLEINRFKKYIFVDEIQTDYPIYSSKLINSIKENSEKHKFVFNELIRIFQNENPNESSDEEIKKHIIFQIKSFQKLFDKFPKIALSAIEKFAKANNFIKIYYPTLGTLIELRGHKNDDGTPSKKLPSKEIYEDLPKKYFYENKGNYPFAFDDLEFYEKNASINKISNLFLKRINKL